MLLPKIINQIQSPVKRCAINLKNTVQSNVSVTVVCRIGRCSMITKPQNVHSQPCIPIKPNTIPEWNYTDKGPSRWGSIFPKHGHGKQQSPVTISSKKAEYDEALQPFSKDLFSQIPKQMIICNSGKSVVFEMENGYTLKKPHLPGNYIAAQFHFHWADKAECCGCEHIVDDQKHFGELHVVHYNTKYNTFEKAVDVPDGLAVLGFFLETSTEEDNTNFGTVLSHINHVRNVGKRSIIEQEFSPSILYPSNLKNYFTYKGSLTTPLFNESVHWIVFKNSIKISKAQANMLCGSLECDDGGKLVNNFRPVQPLNNRKIYKSFK